MFEFSMDLSSVNDASIVIRLLMSILCGGIIGYERGRAGRPAGLRTHILVCLGSTLAILTNQYVYEKYGVSDPTRLGAQVISGIGFLGAGTIIVTGRHQVKGLTTAAGLWATACMGLAIGVGFYKAAIVGCLLIFFSTVVLHRLDNYMLSKSKNLDVYLEFGKLALITNVLDNLRQLDLNIESVEMVKPTYGSDASSAAIMTLRLRKKKMRMDVITRISQIEGIVFAEEI
ncbi:putative Mg2+ transporter-C (MgtC) family protein [Anaerotaenia torta]|uniref:MgtC/SapB family protein n=1 Tax=Anaerotaenia torta TaxID=433293 RepID=UPI003D226869